MFFLISLSTDQLSGRTSPSCMYSVESLHRTKLVIFKPTMWQSSFDHDEVGRQSLLLFHVGRSHHEP